MEIRSGVIEPEAMKFVHSYYFGYWLLQQLARNKNVTEKQRLALLFEKFEKTLSELKSGSSVNVKFHKIVQTVS